MAKRRFCPIMRCFPRCPSVCHSEEFSRHVVLSRVMHVLWHLLALTTSSLFSKSWGVKSQAGNKSVFSKVNPCWVLSTWCLHKELKDL